MNCKDITESASIWKKDFEPLPLINISEVVTYMSWIKTVYQRSLKDKEGVTKEKKERKLMLISSHFLLNLTKLNFLKIMFQTCLALSILLNIITHK